jgi:hypothetical protein
MSLNRKIENTVDDFLKDKQKDNLYNKVYGRRLWLHSLCQKSK